MVSGGPVRGCSVYYGEDVQSCRLKSLTSLVPTGGLYTIFTDWSMLGKIVCVDMWQQRGCQGLIAGWCVQYWALCLWLMQHWEESSQTHCVSLMFTCMWGRLRKAKRLSNPRHSSFKYFLLSVASTWDACRLLGTTAFMLFLTPSFAQNPWKPGTVSVFAYLLIRCCHSLLGLVGIDLWLHCF